MSETDENSPFDNRSNIKVSGVSDLEMNDSVYDTAKMQNRFRWGVVFLLVVLMGGLAAPYLGALLTVVVGCGVCVFAYMVLSKLMPLANLVSTVKYKKYGDELKMDRARAKLGIGQGDDK